MPKLKTKSGAKKRFKVTATGKVMHAQRGKRHGMIKRTKKQIRQLRGTRVLFKTDGGVDALDPERAEGPLLALAVAEGVLAGLFDRGLGGADRVLAAAVITLGGLVDFLVLGVGGHTAFDARHDEAPSKSEK